ncbi:MAG: arylesterase [Burkholderiales bacterium]|uniref:arylesterase n=1 Tax=Nitrosomonas sp. TaxID=42353 RepID=UPI001DAC4CA7|nr:arylesterase [Nitrosomonas sp.]MCB1947692.1 arylesterase [Nitrosomonas sp.]MCP5242946.1 arylesterase [Burkholderiales bacterium]
MKHFLAILIFFFFVAPGTAASNDQQTTTIMVFGDSLSANYGIPTEAGWVHLLEQRLQTLSPVFQVVNASISGETTLGGRNRIQQAIEQHHPDIVILGLGANDGLRGTAIKTIYENLETIINICQQNNISVLLAGMQLPPNYGMTYTQKFQSIYSQLAQRYQTALVPFLLAGFGEKQEFFQTDGIHPTVLAQEKIAENVWVVLHTMIRNNIATIRSES